MLGRTEVNLTEKRKTKEGNDKIIFFLCIIDNQNFITLYKPSNRICKENTENVVYLINS